MEFADVIIYIGHKFYDKKLQGYTLIHELSIKKKYILVLLLLCALYNFDPGGQKCTKCIIK